MTLDLRHLEALIAVAEQGSLTRAAQGLHIGQPALTRTIQQYERAIGTQLITRSPSGSTLTAEGEKYLTRARNAIAAFDHAIESADSPATITVGYVWSALGLCTNAVFEAWNSCPVRAKLILKRFQNRTSGVDTGDADLGIVRYPTPEILYSAELFTEPRLVAVPHGHPLAACSHHLQLSDLTEETIILDSLSGTTTMQLWPPAIRPTRPPITVGSVDEWNHHVSLGEGIGITAESTQHLHPYPGITYIPMHPATAPITVYCIWNSPHLTPIATELADLVRDIHKSSASR